MRVPVIYINVPVIKSKIWNIIYHPFKISTFPIQNL
jgi:hypothetical protein